MDFQCFALLRPFAWWSGEGAHCLEVRFVAALSVATNFVLRGLTFAVS
jgi:hypothetical protein